MKLPVHFSALNVCVISTWTHKHQKVPGQNCRHHPQLQFFSSPIPLSHTQTHKKHSYSPCSSGNAKSPKDGLKDGFLMLSFPFVSLKITFGVCLLLSGVAIWAFPVTIPSHLDPAMTLPTWHLHFSPHIYKVFSQQLEALLEIVKQITRSPPFHPSNGFFPHRS